MKLHLILFFLATSLVSCGSKPEEVVQYYGTGEVSRKHSLVDGKKEGKMIEYYKDGKIKGERLFENDIQVGRTVYYYPSGAVEEVQYFEDGQLHGGDTVFFENGHPKFLRTFTMGKLDGYLRKWAGDGSIIYEAKYALDSLVEVKGQPIVPDSLIQ